MKTFDTRIQNLKIVETIKHIDERGEFMRLFCDEELHSITFPREIVQINFSKTIKKGTIRGLHFQRQPKAEMKFVRCIRGKVWDVAVDLRESSSTYLDWHGEILSSDNNRMLVIPEGFAHGFQVIEPNSEIIYLHTAGYCPRSEGGIRYDDPVLKITWPLPVTSVSERDNTHPFISFSNNKIFI